MSEPHSPDAADPRSDSVSILFETSPYGTIDAIVEHNGDAVYFYLSGQRAGKQDRFGTRACWVRNLKQGPHVIDRAAMEQGIGPMLPRYDCIDPKLTHVPTEQSLRIVWFEEGNGAALMELTPDSTSDVNGKTKASNNASTWNPIAVIPPWSGMEGFHGYASNCAVESEVCWPMPDNPRLTQRIADADAFWNAWLGGDGQSQPTPFADHQPRVLENYSQRFASDQASERYFSIDGNQFPPRGLVHYAIGRFEVLATVGMSVCPQPAVELFVDDPKSFRRIELAALVPRSGDAASLDEAMKQMSGLSGYPWRFLTWLGAGHTCSFRCGDTTSALLLDDATGSRLAGVPMNPLPEFRGDPVRLLWLLPITDQQQSQLEQGQTTADEIVAAVLSHSDV